ncbi:hypothetical protein SAMN02910384_02027 [Pseudobutyrivibrio sp. ACV-2]|uniref:DUF5979 domain-containing protein n=1 Tax=Pseudobutyrivibrio sp. ACV-2 TaxID=1520801 RepID=UPI000897FFE8|nr:DUF5979 domain-containing protein [Pseudobutyrivibrio sp. ACV-2]SEA66033.1 hypothetical protein SAMN02910384_02027 [Pseudobutyrivibrio sp. ACV-2]
MIKGINRKKGLIGIVLAAALVVGTLGAHSIHAAGRVDTDATVKITANIDSGDGSVFASEYKGIVEIGIYKVATVDEVGTSQLLDEFNDGTVDLSVLKIDSENKPSVENITSKIVNPAKDIIEKNGDIEPTRIITLDRSKDEKTSSVDIEAGAGIYLYLPKTVKDEKYKYEFTPYIIYAPTSDYIMSGGAGSDEWKYESVFTLKSKATPLYGSLKIIKHLDKFNENLQAQSFVYTVKAVLDGETVFNSVYKIDMNGAGSAEKVVNKIPVQAIVTVTESYAGSSYISTDESNVKTVDGIVANEIKTVEFNNTYNGKNIIGGIAAENQFVVENGVTYWIDENGDKIPQTKPINQDLEPEVPQEELPQ